MYYEKKGVYDRDKKVWMEIFIQSIDPDAWNAIVKGTFTPTKEVNGELVPKEWDEMKDDEKRKVQDGKKNGERWK